MTYYDYASMQANQFPPWDGNASNWADENKSRSGLESNSSRWVGNWIASILLLIFII